MAPSTIQKAIGAMKDQTTIGIAKVASNISPELKVAIVKATSHDDDPAGEKYIRKILYLTSSSRGYVNACVNAISKRLGKTRDWMVALKCLMLVHRLLNEGNSFFHQELMYATRRGTRLLHMSDFRDEAHSSSWDHSAFVRSFAQYLDQRMEMIVYEKKTRGSGNAVSPPGSNRGSEYDYEHNEFRDEPSYGIRRSRSSGDVKESKDEMKDLTPLKEMKPEKIFGKMGHLQRLMDKFLLCRPSGLAKNEKMVLVALYPLIKESFKLYGDICEVLFILVDKFFDMEHQDCVKAFDAYALASKQIDELIGFYNWCKDIGVVRSSEYPEVQKITSKLLDTLEEFVKDKAKAMNSPEKKVENQPIVEEKEPVLDMNEIKALPPPEDYSPPPPPPQSEPEPPKQDLEPLMDLRDENVTSADDQGNRLALALFAGPPANDTNGSWDPFASKGEDEVTSAWQNPAAEIGKADWELALVESASHLSKQKATMGGGLDPLLLNGMYDQGIITQHVASVQLTGGSASSVALPGPGKTSILALPAPDGSIQTVGYDPFAASLNIPPPSYVQMSDMVKKQQFVVQEQMVWQQYAKDGMQGQSSLTKIGTGGYYATGYPHGMPYGMPSVNPMGMPTAAGYYYTSI